MRNDTDITIHEMLRTREDGLHVLYFVTVQGAVRYKRERTFPLDAAPDEIKSYLRAQHDDAVGFMMVELG